MGFSVLLFDFKAKFPNHYCIQQKNSTEFPGNIDFSHGDITMY